MTDYSYSFGDIVLPVIRWYEQNRRDLPWRAEPTPYHVWLSEIMLQQTRIEAVIPYYRRFLDELPAVSDLAAVDDDKLMKLWQGLGYYSRARNLKKAAVLVMENYGGTLPLDAEELRKLPGIGDYTAGAIASIAYGRPSPAVDGNVLRVVMRLAACSDDIADAKTKKAVEESLRAVYPEGEPASLLTQGIMEIGEHICIPNGAPKCEVCPLAALCRAKAAERQTEFPNKSAKKPRRVEEKTVLLLENGDKFAVRRRPDHGLLAGLFEYPNLDRALSADGVSSYLSEMGFDVEKVEKCGKSKHIFTHIEWNMTGYRVKCRNMPEKFDCLWKAKDEILNALAIPTAYRFYTKIIEKTENKKEK